MNLVRIAIRTATLSLIHSVPVPLSLPSCCSVIVCSLLQFYTNNRSNSYVRDGVLYLRPTLTSDYLGSEALLYGGIGAQPSVIDLWGSQPADLCTGNAFYGCSRTAGAGGNILNPIKSARIRSVNSFNMKYGKIEISAGRVHVKPCLRQSHGWTLRRI